ncbi:hypothetical protein BD626DRAFT_575794 [Schizophyllum amplum]|uniref:Uncharacterized protein n=1 Tax=Schizophyllum amplum TaxID=97359 RepID=A0A550BV00_9AGAR|nr:hypothetical protein BD626DRAFT_575794 [Auriculariopsis ampla]
MSAPPSAADPSTNSARGGHAPSGEQAPSGVPAPGASMSGSGGATATAGPAASPAPAWPLTFRQPRLPSIANYDRTPVADVQLGWVLPWSFRVIHRVQPGYTQDSLDADPVSVGLWSCNIVPISSSTSAHIPFFPGIVFDPIRLDPSEDITAPATNVSQRYADGHLGPGDPCEHAQYYRPGYPHLAFVRRTSPDLAGRYPSYRVVFHSGNTEVEASANQCCATSAFVDALLTENAEHETVMLRLADVTGQAWPDVATHRPSYPSESDIRMLRSLASMDDYVDLVTHVQRGLRVKLAWIELARLLQEDGRRLPVQELRWRGPLDANMSFLGVWINTAPLDEGLWLYIRGRVPAFVAAPSRTPSSAQDAVSPLRRS